MQDFKYIQKKFFGYKLQLFISVPLLSEYTVDVLNDLIDLQATFSMQMNLILEQDDLTQYQLQQKQMNKKSLLSDFNLIKNDQQVFNFLFQDAFFNFQPHCIIFYQTAEIYKGLYDYSKIRSFIQKYKKQPSQN